MMSGTDGCRKQYIIEEPTIGARLEVEAKRRAILDAEGGFSHQHGGEQPRADVVLKGEASST